MTLKECQGILIQYLGMSCLMHEDNTCTCIIRTDKKLKCIMELGICCFKVM